MFLLTCGVLGALYYFTNIFKSDKDMFYKYISQIDMSNFFDKEFYNQYNEKRANGRYEKNGELSVLVTEDGEQVDFLKITYDSDTDNVAKISKTDAKISLLGKEVLKLAILNEQDLYGIIADDIVNRYVVLDNNDLKKFAKNVGVEDTSSIPNKIDFSKYDMTVLELTDKEKEELKGVTNKCMQAIDKQVPNERYSKISNAKIDVDGKSVEANGYRVSFTSEECINIAIDVLKIISDDEVIFNIVNSRLDDIEMISFDDYQEYVKDIINQLEYDIIYAEKEELEEEILTITVYEKDNEFVKLDIEIVDGDSKVNIFLEKMGSRTIIQVIETNEYTFFEEEYKTETILKIAKSSRINEAIWEISFETKENGEVESSVSVVITRIRRYEF